MAYAEISVCLAKTLWSLDVRRPDGEVRDIEAGRIGTKGGREKEDHLGFNCLNILLVSMMGRIWNGLREVTRKCIFRN